MASIDEEKKNALRKLNREKDELKEENESLKRKVRELEEFKHKEPLSARRSVCFFQSNLDQSQLSSSGQ